MKHCFFMPWCRIQTKSLGDVLRFALGLGLLLIGAGQSFAQPLPHPILIAAQPSPSAAQVQGMAGYVLNSQTNMNNIYTQKLNRELMPQPNLNLDDGPLIQYVGPPPQAPPNGPVWQALPTTRPGLP